MKTIGFNDGAQVRCAGFHIECSCVIGRARPGVETSWCKHIAETFRDGTDEIVALHERSLVKVIHTLAPLTTKPDKYGYSGGDFALVKASKAVFVQVTFHRVAADAWACELVPPLTITDTGRRSGNAIDVGLIEDGMPRRDLARRIIDVAWDHEFGVCVDCDHGGVVDPKAAHVLVQCDPNEDVPEDIRMRLALHRLLVGYQGRCLMHLAVHREDADLIPSI